MFTYNVAPSFDNKIFAKTCSIIKSKIKEIKKEKLFVDVLDGTQIKTFETNRGKIKVYNDYDVGAVYVDSEFDLKEIIKQL